jgi:DNA polymerase epsilon subunit 1
MKEVNRTENYQHISSGLPQFTDKINKGDAALEFIKHVCAVLALDQNVQHDVLVILVH